MTETTTGVAGGGPAGMMNAELSYRHCQNVFKLDVARGDVGSLEVFVAHAGSGAQVKMRELYGQA